MSIIRLVQNLRQHRPMVGGDGSGGRGGQTKACDQRSNIHYQD